MIDKKLIAGNWKMNLDRDGCNQLAYDLLMGLSAEPEPKVDCLICPPFIYLDRCTKFFGGSPVFVGAQDCAPHDNGAHTGDISARMLAGMGASHVILGHSERRHGHGETNDIIARKAAQAHAHGLVTIICVGETESERAAGQEQEVVARQLKGSIPHGASLKNLIIAYEPVWAIGTGKTATPDDAATMHEFIRSQLKNIVQDPEFIKILYGGSMKPDNAAALLSRPNIDGGLIGGASLKAEDFMAIGRAVK